MDVEEVKKADTSNWIAVVPFGATEQHGPHLPFQTDSLIASGIVSRLKTQLPSALPVTFLPVEEIGYSPEHMDFEGSKSLSYEEALNRWVSIGALLHSLGFKKMVLLNAHGGNSPLLSIVATEMRVRYDMLCVATSWTRFGKPDGLISQEDAAIDIHGGEIETSVMLALEPSKVDIQKAENFASQQSVFAERFSHLLAYGKHAFGWKMQDLNEKGVVGNAKNASAEKGEALLAHSVEGLVELLNDVKKFDLSLLKKKS
ncbi:MAG: creatininase family protein [Nitratireductor sp.]